MDIVAPSMQFLLPLWMQHLTIPSCKNQSIAIHEQPPPPSLMQSETGCVLSRNSGLSHVNVQFGVQVHRIECLFNNAIKICRKTIHPLLQENSKT